MHNSIWARSNWLSIVYIFSLIPKWCLTVSSNSGAPFRGTEWCCIVRCGNFSLLICKPKISLLKYYFCPIELSCRLLSSKFWFFFRSNSSLNIENFGLNSDLIFNFSCWFLINFTILFNNVSFNVLGLSNRNFSSRILIQV